ncbi:ferredoxin [Peteryoungia desertarenae]|uniref:Ferredoxin n=1 Tax=Peteryoungia desertarenae TaxID=1813451 RepID=A0ABX6QPQ3_9HYPH|nr:ferredoxin [Peteryoungia desertarenae]QLF70498.1 ferredoxin [Peteryoungia desertarenae]
MSGPSSALDELERLLSPHGLYCRGIVACSGRPDAPLGPGGEAARSVVLIGAVGGSNWPSFETWQRQQGPVDHPLDRWSQFVLEPIAAALGAKAYFPSEPPYQPFQRWAMEAEGLSTSPLGILIHPVYGLWHSYRGALAFDVELPTEQRPTLPSPCQSCESRPCLTTCPANAVSEEGFDVEACRIYLASKAGDAGCMNSACKARNACPVGQAYRYGPAQLRFHMAALMPP